jgi:DNA-binding IclR family transcriptional regulator
MVKVEDKFYVQSVNRTLEIIQKISEANTHGLSITEISKAIDLPVSTVYRLIQNLLAWNYVYEKEDGHYTLGLRLLELGSIVQQNVQVRNIAKKYMEELNRITKETIYMAVLDDKANNLIYVEKLDSKRNVNLVAGVGTRNYIHSTANGKCVVSAFSDEKIIQILSKTGMPKLTEHTITDINKFLEEVHKVREQGYAVDDLENESSVRCVAAPIYDYRNSVVASISISGVSTYIDHEKMFGEYKDLVIEAAENISKELGYKKLN